MDTTSFLIYCIIATFTPGPTNIVILSTVNHYGPIQAMRYTLGATIGFGLLLTIAAVLNAVLITIMPKVTIVMQLIGTVYMVYLAYKIYTMDASSPTSSETASMKSGLIMQFLNPKVVLFALTVLPSFVLPYYSSSSAISVSIIVITIIGFAAFMTWVLFGTVFKQLFQRHSQIVNILMALSLAYAAFMIWM